jgi:hypothetical protein
VTFAYLPPVVRDLINTASLAACMAEWYGSPGDQT